MGKNRGSFWRGSIAAGSLIFAISARADLACPVAGAAASPPTGVTATSVYRDGIWDLLQQQGAAVADQSIASCFATSAALPSCLKRAEAMIADDLVISSAAYDTPATNEPRRQPPPELIDNLDATWAFTVRPDVEQIAQTLGWPAVRYKSRHAGGFDPSTPSLLLVRVPGAKLNPPVDYDRYLNFALPADGPPNELTPTPQAPFPTLADYAFEAQRSVQLPQIFTIVSVEHPKPNSPAQVFFQIYQRPTMGDPHFHADSPPTVMQCFSCHPNGLRAISPLGYHVRAGEAQLAPDQWRAVKEMNDSMGQASGSAMVDWRGALNPSTGKLEKFLVPAGKGPSLGPIQPLTRTVATDPQGQRSTTFPTRTQAFIVGADGRSGCAYAQTTLSVVDIFGRAPGRNNIYTMDPAQPVEWQRVRDSMMCTGCHNNQSRAALTASTDFAQIQFKILVDQSMPYGVHHDPLESGNPAAPAVDSLTGNDRIALVNCLNAEFQQEREQTEAWFKADSCGS